LGVPNSLHGEVGVDIFLLLSGALLAFRRDTWNIVGPMDDRYHLYFEEDDWLCRIARAKLHGLSGRLLCSVARGQRVLQRLLA